MATKQNAPTKAELIPYDSLFAPGDAQKATQLVVKEIEEQRKQLEQLRAFSSENANLVNLVRKLPDDLHHQIMVPFGKAAFFPGRLVHTNEFLVLLGEGYYAESTAKQTVGVLTRRGQLLESNMESLRAIIADLEARAEFFGATAGESAEGIVEIREFEDPQKSDAAGATDSGSPYSSNKHIEKQTITDEEYERILAGLDDLEREELAAEIISTDNEDACAKTKILDHTGDHLINTLGGDSVVIPTGTEEATRRVQFLPNTSLQEAQKLQTSDTYYRTKVHSTTGASHERVRKDNFSHKCMDSSRSFQSPVPPKDTSTRDSKYKESAREVPTTSYTQRKAFTGTVVERGDGMDSSLSSPSASQATASKSSKPVSRFKMQRGS